MKSAEAIAHAIVPIGLDIQEGISWLREDIADVLRPLLAAEEKLEGLLEVVADVVARGSHALMNPQVFKNLSDALKLAEKRD